MINYLIKFKILRLCIKGDKDSVENIIKNPTIIYDIKNILLDNKIKIKTIILPIRDY